MLFGHVLCALLYYQLEWLWGLMVTGVALPSAVQFSVISKLLSHQSHFPTHFFCSKGDKNLNRRSKLHLVPRGECFFQETSSETTISSTLLFPHQAEADEAAVVDARLLYLSSLLNGATSLWCDMVVWKCIFCVQGMPEGTLFEPFKLQLALSGSLWWPAEATTLPA